MSHTPSVSSTTAGWFYGLLGMLSFSLTLPATRVAVAELNPIFVGLGRALVAAALAAILLKLTQQPVPSRSQIKSLLLVAAGVVVGFPILSAWALRIVPASHGAIMLGLLPLATVIAGVLRAGDRPSRGFWAASSAGSSVVIVFAIVSGGGHIQGADLALLVAVIAAAIGYAEGARLAREIGSWQVICWALLIAAPFLLVPVGLTLLRGVHGSPSAWIGFAYVSVFSMFLGFFAWYRGLALGGVARVGQLQLLQPFFTLGASALLLGEQITPATILVALVVAVIVALGRKARVDRAPAVQPVAQGRS
ncbi:MAG TPA: DMT family transporter [Herpetosiphonaceae bacterium]